LFWQVPDALILSLKRRMKHFAWLYMLRFIATFLTNWYITPWQHNTSINRNKLWNSYLVCAIRHCSPACLVHNFRCQWYTVVIETRKQDGTSPPHAPFIIQSNSCGSLRHGRHGCVCVFLYAIKSILFFQPLRIQFFQYQKLFYCPITYRVRRYCTVSMSCSSIQCIGIKRYCTLSWHATKERVTERGTMSINCEHNLLFNRMGKSTLVTFIQSCCLWKENLNSDGQQFYQYQPLLSSNRSFICSKLLTHGFVTARLKYSLRKFSLCSPLWIGW
jgi:hypothetical protein